MPPAPWPCWSSRPWACDRVRVDLAAQYVDHNLLQTDFKNADDHRYLQSACARYGLHFSQPGNGISHQVHLENFGKPGITLIGADSHTPAAAGLSMLAFGAGGLDVALAMAGRPYYLPCPKVLGVKLIGTLPDWVSAKDIILEMLRRYGVKGCVGMVVEYYGPGVATLTVEDRAAIGNMGTELGATSSIFPSDEHTRQYLAAQQREADWQPLQRGSRSGPYDEYDEIDLAEVEPLIACPSSPGNVVPVGKVAGTQSRPGHRRFQRQHRLQRFAAGCRDCRRGGTATADRFPYQSRQPAGAGERDRRRRVHGAHAGGGQDPPIRAVSAASAWARRREPAR